MDVPRKVDEVLASRKNSNNITEILNVMQNDDDSVIPCIQGMEKLFVSLFQRNEFYVSENLKLADDEEWKTEVKYVKWLQGTYEETLKLLYKCLESKKQNIGTLSLACLMKFLSMEAKYPLQSCKEKNPEKVHFPLHRLEEIMKVLISTKLRTNHLITSYENYGKYSDIFFYTWKILKKTLPMINETNDIFMLNVLQLMEVLHLPNPSAKNSKEMTVFKDGSLCEIEGGNDFVVHFHQVQKFMGKVWQNLINRNFSVTVYQKLMVILLEKFLPNLEKPIYFTDFFMSSANLGGANALLAMQGILVLVQKHNIEYPNIYGKLYSMFEPNTINTKYRSRLFYLADIFLSSTHLPENLVASFAKRVARLCLSAQISNIVIGIHFIENLLLRHPGLRKMIHYPENGQVKEDPFLEDEPNPMKTKAIESCLWEISILKSHIQPSVSSLANFIDKNLRTIEADLRESLDVVNEEIFESESKKRLKTCLSISRPVKLAKLQDDRNLLLEDNMKSLMDYAEWLPFLQLALLIVTFTTTYIVAVELKHVYPFWPYISDTGTLAPESCIFSLLLNFTSAILAVIMYIRHRQVSEFTALRPFIRISRKWNITCSVIGFTGIFGLVIVANFQETNAFMAHIIGALVCFVFSTIYFLIQCVFTHKMRFVSKLIFWLRIIFTAINIICFVSIFAPIEKAMEKYKGNNVLMWRPKDGGHDLHLVSTISEWILVLSFCLYISTFYWEFKRFQIVSHNIKFYGIEEDEEVVCDVQEPVRTVASRWL